MTILVLTHFGKKPAISARFIVALILFLFTGICAFPKDQLDKNPRLVSNNQSSQKQFYIDLTSKEAKKYHLPPDIADAVMAIESGYDPDVVGTVGEIGLMQVRPETATMLGFDGKIEDLAKPEINIHYGVRYLSEAWRLAHGDLCRALMKYRAGHGEEIMSALSADYCNRARAHMASIGSPFAAGPVPIMSDLDGTEPERREHPIKMMRTHGPQLRTLATSRAFWAAEERRVKAISARLERKWHRMAAR